MRELQWSDGGRVRILSDSIPKTISKHSVCHINCVGVYPNYMSVTLLMWDTSLIHQSMFFVGW